MNLNEISWVIIIVVFIPLNVISSAFFFARRKIQPIQARHPMFTLLFNALTWPWMLNGALKGFVGDTWPCALSIAADYLYVTSAVVIYVARTWLLFFQFEYAFERVALASNTQTIDWFSRHKHWMNPSNIMKYTLLAFLVLTTPFIYYIKQLPSLNHPVKGCAQRDTVTIIINAIEAVAVFIFAVLIFKLRRQFDFFWLKKELKCVLIMCSILLVGFVVVKAFFVEFDQNTWEVSDVLAAQFILFSLFFSTAIPSYLTFTMNKGRSPTATHISTSAVPTALGEHEENHSKSKEGAKSSQDGAFFRMMDNVTMRALFKQFLIGEFSVENLLFYEAVEQWKLLTGNEEIRSATRQITDTFIRNTGVMTLNLSPITRDKVLAKSDAYLSNTFTGSASSIFDEAIREIVNLMRNDSFRRFRNSSLYKGVDGDEGNVGNALQEIGINTK